MNTKFPRLFIGTTILTLALAFGATLRAAPAAPGQSGPAVVTSTSPNSPAPAKSAPAPVISPAPTMSSHIVSSPAPVNSSVSANPSVLSNPPAPTSLLSKAYAALFVADHDYHGHRIRAMRQIEAAARELGFNLQGNGHGEEPQATSDQQLHAALNYLQQAVNDLPAGTKGHVEKAIHQLSVALSIK